MLRCAVPQPELFHVYKQMDLQFQGPEKTHCLRGQGIFIRKELFQKVGGFPSIRIMEDLQFSMNLKAMGIPPGMAEHRILASDRRYRGSTVHKLLVMRNMARMRRRYMEGMDPCQGELEYERLCPDRRTWREKNNGYLFVKRILDIVLGMTGLVMLSPGHGDHSHCRKIAG